jgi:hypothetical protein
MGTPSVGSVVLPPSRSRTFQIPKKDQQSWLLVLVGRLDFAPDHKQSLLGSKFDTSIPRISFTGDFKYGVTEDQPSCLPQTSLSSLKRQVSLQWIPFSQFEIR